MSASGTKPELIGRKPWVVVGRIVGECLPDREVRIGRFFVGPARGSAIERAPGLRAEPSGEWHFTSTVGDLRVKSACYFWMYLEASSAEAAIQRVRENELPALQMSFWLSCRKPYRTEILWAEQGKSRVSNFGPRLGVAVFSPRTPSVAEMAEITKHCDSLKADPTAERAATLMTAALYQYDTCEDPAQVEGALLGFFKVIELIARKVSGDLAPSDAIETRRREIVTRLRQLLNSSKSDVKKAIAISDAHRALDRLDRRYLQLQIAAAADHLMLGPTWKEEAQKFADFRHKKLGHPGASTTVQERVALLDETAESSAVRLALALLAAYVSNRDADSSS